MNTDPMGVYGNYASSAPIVEMLGLGGQIQVEDANLIL